MRIKSIFKIALLATTWLISFSSQAEPLLSDDEKEVVLFFSYKCNSCYQTSAYLSAWDLQRDDVRVRRVPVFSGETWRAEARLFFLLELSKDRYPLTGFKRRQAAFSLAQTEDMVDSKEYFLSLFRRHGMEFTALEFSQWWDASSVMMLSTQEILEEVSIFHSEVPFVRVNVSGNNEAVYYSGEDPQGLIRQLNKKVN
ncbi:MAG: hypothetical protein GY774_13475 [Planctomycetes bacterium]|nr:hypothetical protein [Planctomycetota bacterium]